MPSHNHGQEEGEQEIREEGFTRIIIYDINIPATKNDQ